MGKQIVIRYKDKDYTLEYNRRAVIELEKDGFNPKESGSKILTSTWMLFKYAFYMHHKSTSEGTIDEIFTGITKKDDFFKKLMEMYGDTVNSIIADGDESSELTWGANW